MGVFLKKRMEMIASLSPPRMIVLSFAFIIAVGTVLLLFPWATKGSGLTFLDALFTAVSATCVTGLTVVDIGSEFTLYGQLVVLVLIQAGGLGIMTFSTFFLYILGRRVSIRGREVIDSTLGSMPVQSIGRLLWKIMFVVFFLEGMGALVLTVGWLRFYSLKRAIYHGIFHAVSAFCNAGFSLYRDSLEGFRSDWMTNVVFMGLIVLGGLGFIVLLDLGGLLRRPGSARRRFSFHSKVVLSVTFFLIVWGALFLFWVERFHGLSRLDPGTGFLASLFQSVTARTAGFNTVRMDALTNGGCLVVMFLMFIGVAPGSCGGGVKVTTLGILAAMVLSRLRGDEEPHLFYRSIPRETVGKALAIVMSSVLLVLVVFLGLLLTEGWAVAPDASRGHFLELFFETISAFGTVGLSMGVTPTLTQAGRVLIIVLMFVGRLGPLTMAVALTRRKPRGRFRYARGEVMVG